MFNVSKQSYKWMVNTLPTKIGALVYTLQFSIPDTSYFVPKDACILATYKISQSNCFYNAYFNIFPLGGFFRNIKKQHIWPKVKLILMCTYIFGLW